MGDNMAGFENVPEVLQNTLLTAVESTLTKTVEALPGLIIAAIIFVIGWIVAVLFAKIFRKFLEAIKLEEFLKENKVEDALGTVKMSDVLTKIVKYYVILIFLQAAAAFIALESLSWFINQVLLYAPAVIAGAIVFVASMLFGEYVKEAILDLRSKSAGVQFVARASKFLIVFIGLTTALSTIGYRTELIENIFLTLIQAIAFGLTLAVGIAFGLGGQKDAHDLIVKVRKHFKI